MLTQAELLFNEVYRCFNISGLKTICFDLGYDFENLKVGRGTKTEIIYAIFEESINRRDLVFFLAACRQMNKSFTLFSKDVSELV